MVTDAAGNVYFTNELQNNTYAAVLKWTASSGALSLVAGSTNGANGPFGLAIDSAGDLYWANSGNNPPSGNTIEEKTAGGTFVTLATSTNGVNTPEGIAVDSSGNVYWGNNGGTGLLEEHSVGGTVSTLGTTPGNGVNAVATDGLYLYYTTTGGKVVEYPLVTTSQPGGWQTSTAEVGPSTETCNNKDDDCDGYTDNASGSTTNYSLPGCSNPG